MSCSTRPAGCERHHDLPGDLRDRRRRRRPGRSRRHADARCQRRLGLSGLLSAVRGQSRGATRRAIAGSRVSADDRQLRADVINSPSQFAIGSQATFGEASAGSGGGTNIKGANIIGFTKGSGVFAGALSGAYVNALQALNQSYYNSGSATPTAILIDHAFSNPMPIG